MRPRIALTIGDPNGIGPEIVAKVLSDPETVTRCHPIVIGDTATMASAARLVDAELTFHTLAAGADVRADAEAKLGQIGILRPEGMALPEVRWGNLDPAMGQVAAACLRTALQLGMAGQIDGFVAAPMNKQAFHLAGYDYLDELAFFSEITGSERPYFMGVIGKVLTVSVTEHIAFRDILANLTYDNILWYIRKMDQALTKADPTHRRIGVAALNPHAGEGGLLGSDEIDTIIPAIEAARAEGLSVTGPIPADVIFPEAIRGDFDGIVCMYHDQANIGRKLQPPEVSATIYRGLPVVGTTTAHGTAFDIAGQGIADPGSLLAALNAAIRLAQ